MVSDALLPSELDEDVAQLYAVAPERFVAERTAFAKRLRAAGRPSEAAEVAKLRKPTLAAWALDGASRGDAARIDALIEAGEKLRVAQIAVMAGDASPDELRTALEARRAITRAIADDAVRRVEEKGGNGEGFRSEIVSTLDAASLDDDLVAELAAGRLARTVASPTGFDLLGDVSFAASSAPADAASARREAKERVRATRAALDAARERFESVSGEVQRLERELARARRELDAATSAVAAAERAASDAERDAGS